MKFLKKGIFMLLLIALVGCAKTGENNDYATIQEKMINMETYASEGNVTYISNKGETTYGVIQLAKKDGKYILKTTTPENVAGNIILFDGNIVWQYNPKLDSKISVGEKDKMERKEISIFTFLENHIKSKDIALQTANMEDELYTILEAKIPGGNKFFATEKLWINNKTKLPEKLVIYDTDNKERVIFNITKFEYNKELNDEMFKIENIEKDK